MTGRWRPLPGSLAPEVAYLVTLLRELKDRSGSSLAALAARTAYSKSSWERYLNGTTLPPRDAVEALGRLAGEPVERLIALWERAEAPWRGRDGEARPAAAEPRAAPAAAADHQRPRPVGSGARGWRRAAVTVGVLVAALVVSARPLGVFAPAGSPASAVPVPVTVGCRGAGCAGRDAYDMACDVDAASVADLRIGQAYVELRVSDRCGAAWARISHSTVGDRIQVLDRAGRTAAVAVSDEASTARYLRTPMLPADRHSRVRACLQPPGGERRCTAWGADRPVPVPPPTRLP